MRAKRPLLLAALLVPAAALLAGDAPRVLPFQPLASAKAGDRARYEGTSADTAGKVYETYLVAVEVASVDDDEVQLKVTTRTSSKDRALPRDADAAQIIEALRLLPPGMPLDGLKAAPAKARVRGAEVEATRATLEAKLMGGALSVSFEALFAKEAGPLGLVSARTAVSGGGAGVSTLALKE